MGRDVRVMDVGVNIAFDWYPNAVDSDQMNSLVFNYTF